MMPRSLGFTILSLLLTVAFLLTATPATAQVQKVTPANPAGWLIGPFGTAPSVSFVPGPATPPFGSDSYGTEISVPASKIILGRNGYHDLPLAGLNGLSFWTYVAPTATNTNNWYVNLYVDADGDGAYETRLDYVPPPAQVTQGAWQQWDALTGLWAVSTGGSSSLADFLSANPNARVNAFDNPEALAIRWNMGDTASSYVGFNGNLDGVRIAFDGVGDTTWDFEQFSSVVAVPTLSEAALALFAGLLLITAALTIRRKT